MRGDEWINLWEWCLPMTVWHEKIVSKNCVFFSFHSLVRLSSFIRKQEKKGKNFSIKTSNKVSPLCAFNSFTARKAATINLKMVS